MHCSDCRLTELLAMNYGLKKLVRGQFWAKYEKENVIGLDTR